MSISRRSLNQQTWLARIILPSDNLEAKEVCELGNSWRLTSIRKHWCVRDICRYESYTIDWLEKIKRRREFERLTNNS